MVSFFVLILVEAERLITSIHFDSAISVGYLFDHIDSLSRRSHFIRSRILLHRHLFYECYVLAFVNITTPLPLYYISAEEYSKKMQAASMPNAIAFVAHRSRFHLPSKPLGFFGKNLAHVLFIYLPF